MKESQPTVGRQCKPGRSDGAPTVPTVSAGEIVRSKNRRKRDGIGPDDPRHGTKAGYIQGCRCESCRASYSVYQGERRRAKRLLLPPVSCRTCSAPFYPGAGNGHHCDECKRARIKFCSSCGTVKPYEEFYKNAQRTENVESYCKVCSIAARDRPACVDCGVLIHRSATRCKPCNAPISSARQLLGKPRKNNHGYVLIHQPDNPGANRKGWVLEHRAVMEAGIGRHLLPGENVHHRNGQRDDNRIENLELWVVSQPYGQRPEDLLAWARHIIRTYGGPDESEDES